MHGIQSRKQISLQQLVCSEFASHLFMTSFRSMHVGQNGPKWKCTTAVPLVFSVKVVSILCNNWVGKRKDDQG